MRIILPLLALPLLAACGNTVVQKEFVRVNVPVPAPCPDAATMVKVNGARPKPLRSQPRPTPAEGQTQAQADAEAVTAQLGRYERPNAWADQAQAVMDRCFKEGAEPTAPPSP